MEYSYEEGEECGTNGWSSGLFHISLAQGKEVKGMCRRVLKQKKLCSNWCTTLHSTKRGNTAAKSLSGNVEVNLDIDGRTSRESFPRGGSIKKKDHSFRHQTSFPSWITLQGWCFRINNRNNFQMFRNKYSSVNSTNVKVALEEWEKRSNLPPAPQFQYVPRPWWSF